MQARIRYPVVALLALLAAACDRTPTQPPVSAGAAGPRLATQTQYICLDQPIPAGFVILRYDTTSLCPYRNGFWNARFIGQPNADGETVCRDSPTPPGWVHTSYLHSDGCRFAGSPQNAIRIAWGHHTQRICAAGPWQQGWVHVRYGRRADCPGYGDTTRFNSIEVWPPDFEWWVHWMGMPVCASGPRPHAMHTGWSRRPDCPGYRDTTRFNAVSVMNFPLEDEWDAITICTSSPRRWNIGGLPGVHTAYGRSASCRGYPDTTRFNTVTIKLPFMGGEVICRAGPYPGGFVVYGYGRTARCPGRTGANAMYVGVGGFQFRFEDVCLSSPGISGRAYVAYVSSSGCGNPMLTNAVTINWSPQAGDTICSTSTLPGWAVIAAYGRSRACRNYSRTGFNTWVLGVKPRAVAVNARAPRTPGRRPPMPEVWNGARIEIPEW